MGNFYDIIDVVSQFIWWLIHFFAQCCWYAWFAVPGVTVCTSVINEWKDMILQGIRLAVEEETGCWHKCDILSQFNSVLVLWVCYVVFLSQNVVGYKMYLGHCMYLTIVLCLYYEIFWTSLHFLSLLGLIKSSRARQDLNFENLKRLEITFLRALCTFCIFSVWIEIIYLWRAKYLIYLGFTVVLAVTCST